MSRNDEYIPGNPEYDYWNDKNLYPDLREDGSNGCPDAKVNHDAEVDDAGMSGGVVFGVIGVWVFFLALMSLFLSWEDGIFRAIFWGGIVIIVIVFLLWLCEAAIEEKHKK